MSVTRISSLCLVLILSSPALGTFPFAYSNPQVLGLSLSPHLVYNAPAEGIPDLSGFSYFTRDFDGGQSEVLLFTGQNADVNLTNEATAMRDQLGYLPPSPSTSQGSSEVTKSKGEEDKSSGGEEVKASGSDEVKSSGGEDVKSSEDTGKVATPAPSLTPEIASEEKTKTAEAEKPKEKASSESGSTLDAVFREHGVGFQTPYPILRFGGSAASYHPQWPASFDGFPGYEPSAGSEYFRSQYEPSFYGHYNPYQSQYNPVYPSPAADEWYDPLFPTLYQAPSFTSSVNNFISGEPLEWTSAGFRKSSELLSKVDKRFGGETENSTPGTEKTGKDSTDQSASSTMKPESSTSEQVSEKSSESVTTTATPSEKSPTTTESMESTTTVA